MIKCWACKALVDGKNTRKVCKVCREEMFGVGPSRRHYVLPEPTPASATAEQAEMDDKRASDT